MQFQSDKWELWALIDTPKLLDLIQLLCGIFLKGKILLRMRIENYNIHG